MTKLPSRDKRLPLNDAEAKYLDRRDDFQRGLFEKALWGASAAVLAAGGGAAGNQDLVVLVAVIVAAVLGFLGGTGLMLVQARYGRLADMARREEEAKRQAQAALPPSSSGGTVSRSDSTSLTTATLAGAAIVALAATLYLFAGRAIPQAQTLEN